MSPVLAENALDGGQSNSRAFKIFQAVEPLKDAEQLIGILHAKADTVVTDVDHRLAIHCPLPHLDKGALAGAGEFDGIQQKVGKHLPHQARVAIYKG